MNIEIFAICDYVQSVGSTVNILGTFETIRNNKLPFTKSFHVIIRLRYEPESDSKKALMFRLLDPNGEELLQPLKNEVGIPAHSNRTVCINHIIGFENMVFRKYGKYQVVVESHGQKFDLPFYVEPED
ncbi:MAG: hypothetical protein LBB62_07525 [Proteiniphilum sp.]|jgi:hypothetical protein|nr:hypothetical protein [Proteiniphilum sp.]